MPSLDSETGNRGIQLDWEWFVCPRSSRLLLMAAAVGLIGAIYWTFAVDLIVAAGLSADWVKVAFWFVSGAAGILGMIVGGAIRRYGLRIVIPVNMVVLALALGLPALIPTSLVIVMFSAACFGAGFVAATGMLSIWSVQVFSERPAAGLGAVLILMAVGQVVGPAIAGVIAEQVGLVPIFMAGVVIALLGIAMRPRPVNDLNTNTANTFSGATGLSR